jgi:ribosome-associated protein
VRLSNLISCQIQTAALSASSSDEFEQEYDRPSKSELKRQMNELQKLGEQLVAPRDRVKRVPMPEDVRDAILMCQTITNHEGRRRQLQFVGKKMRTLDEEEVAVIQRTIDSWKGASKAETAALHALERRRDKLLADDKALTSCWKSTRNSTCSTCAP